jgi:hypothetical protein
MEFTHVELASGTELTTLMEKAVTGGRRSGEEGRPTARARWRCWPAERRCDGERGMVAEAARRSVVAERCRGAAVM